MGITARHDGPDAFRAARPRLAPGPVGICLAEDDVEVGSTLKHMARIGFRSVVLFSHPAADDPPPGGLDLSLHRVDWTPGHAEGMAGAVNSVIDVTHGLWLHYAFNAEYLFYPFLETRSVGEMLSFHGEERREAMLCYVVDLYADDLGAQDDGVCPEAAHLDRSGYYALARLDPETGMPLERQFDFHGGLKWRFEEHVPPGKRRIDRIALFRSRPGLRLRPDYTLNDPEMNTHACPWHHNLTAALCSFRTAKALRRNAGSREAIETFTCRNSTRFSWRSEQLLDLGLMEPGQWF